MGQRDSDDNSRRLLLASIRPRAARSSLEIVEFAVFTCNIRRLLQRQTISIFVEPRSTKLGAKTTPTRAEASTHVIDMFLLLIGPRASATRRPTPEARSRRARKPVGISHGVGRGFCRRRQTCALIRWPHHPLTRSLANQSPTNRQPITQPDTEPRDRVGGEQEQDGRMVSSRARNRRRAAHVLLIGFCGHQKCSTH